MRKYLAYYENEWPANIAELTAVENKPFVGYLKGLGVSYTVVPKPVVGPADNEIWYYTLDGELSYPNMGMIDYRGYEGTIVDPFNTTIVSNSQILEPTDEGDEEPKGIIKLADKLTKINGLAYLYNSNISEIYLPNSLLEIENGAFTLSSLVEINLPSSITKIGWGAFEYCSGLRRINFNGTTSQWDSVIKEDYWNRNVPATHVQCTDGQVAL